MKTLLLGLLALFGSAGAASAAPAAKILDCPLRDARFSVESPLIDLLLNPAARSTIESVAPGRLARMPSLFIGTAAPTFAAILTFRTAGAFMGLSPEQIARADRQFRALAVTDADRRARCGRYDDERPTLVVPAGKPRILLFEKINGFRDGPSVDAAHAAFSGMAARNHWALATTDRGGAINAATLRQFDVVIWNNISGDVLTLTQRAALRRWIEGGGGFVAVHGAGGDPSYFWDWYVDRLIGARFEGHPLGPQFQDARVVISDAASPITRGLPSDFHLTEEWYSFKTNPRAGGAHVLATLDESSYSPVGMAKQDLRMGDHPIVWTKCVKRGRSLYSAIGHRPEMYTTPYYVRLLEQGVAWAAERGGCETGVAR